MYTGRLVAALSAASLGIGGILGASYQQTTCDDRCQHETDCISILPLPSVSAKALPSSPAVVSPSLPANRVSQIMKHGFPSLDNLRTFEDYVLSYDRRNRTANWVFEHLHKGNVHKVDGIDREKCDFTEDTSIHQHFRATNQDYKGSGYDRGHLVAAGNHRASQKAMEQTFLLSNIAPQVIISAQCNVPVCDM